MNYKEIVNTASTGEVFAFFKMTKYFITKYVRQTQVYL